MADIAAACGVSPQHVSRTLNGSGRVSSATRDRILEAVKHTGYDRQFRRNCIAVLSPGNLDDWNGVCLEILAKHGKKGVILPFRSFTVDDERFFDAAIYLNGIDRVGKIWPSKFHIPLICINQYGDEAANIESVLPDADGEMFLAVEHLTALGHKRIARLHPVNFSGSKRNVLRGENAFFKAAASFRIRDFVRNENYEPAWRIKQLIPRLLADGFTAFIVVADPDHRRVLESFQNAGKRIPEDISLIVYEIGLPPELGLTSLEINNLQVVATGVRLLLDKLEGRSIPQQTLIPGTIHIRNSTGKAST